jgi:hypothetical protein
MSGLAVVLLTYDGVKADASGAAVDVDDDHTVDSVVSLFSLITKLIRDISSSPYLGKYNHII